MQFLIKCLIFHISYFLRRIVKLNDIPCIICRTHLLLFNSFLALKQI